MSVRLPLAALAVAFLAGSAAQAQGPAKPDPSAVRPGLYTIEPTHTRVLFSVSHMGFTTYYGRFANGPREADITGELTLHGVTRPVTLHAHFNGAGVNPLSHGYTTGFEVTGTIQRSAFGVTKYVPLVGDTVTLMISAAFEKAAR